MCRFVSYIGNKPIIIKDLIEAPSNSLIKQSRHAKQGQHGINADGFGLAWYNKEIEDNPGIFKSIQPAWNDKNLIHLSSKITSNCFLGHVRASTVGDVEINNCHPFFHKQYCFVHNGTIRFFEKVRRDLMNELNDTYYGQIKSQTDSELLFFLIMQFLDLDPKHNLENSIISAFKQVLELQKNHDLDHFSRLNIVITDGSQMIATRFVSKNKEPLSLYYTTHGFFNSGTSKHLSYEQAEYVIIASEPLNDFDHEWNEISPNKYLTVKSDLSYQVQSFDY